MAALPYEIQVQGYLGDDWSEWFEGLTVSHVTGAGDERVRTILSGPMDQAMLHGVLLRVFSLGLPLISVRRAVTGTATANPAQTCHREER